MMRLKDMRWRGLLRPVLGVALALGCPSCGFGTGGVVAAIRGGGGGRTNAPSTPAGLQVLDPKVSPARIRLVLTDAEADAATVRFLFVAPNAPSAEVQLTQLTQNPMKLSASREGTVHEIEWNFAGEPALPGRGSFVDGVVLIARVQGGVTQSTVTGLGNDAPVVESVQPPVGEITGVVPVGFRLSDTSSDAVDVTVEFFQLSNPSAGWRVARPAGAIAPIGGAAFRGVVAPPMGIDLVFFWDTDSQVGDLRDLESDVRVRFRPSDAVALGLARESTVFRVDNNDEPLVQLAEGAFLANPGDGRGVPIPYTVSDAEGNDVRVLLQWRRQSQLDFPALGTSDPRELAQLVKDPRFVREKQICTPFPAFAHGRVSPVDATTVLLPELRQGEPNVFANGGVRTLELLRSQPLASLSTTWSQNPLSMPVAALPIGDGITAMVLDASASTSRLLEVDLATGAVVRAVADGLAGLPTALALESGGRRALVATDLGGSPQLFEVEFSSGAARALLGSGQPIGPLRAVLSIGNGAALATAGNALWRLDWSGSGAVVRLRDNLAMPWGLAGDPLRPGRVLIAERDGGPTGSGRIVSFDLGTRSLEVVPASSPMGSALPRPTSIAIGLTGAGPLLIALCDAAIPPQRQLRGVNLGQGDDTAFSLGLVDGDAAAVSTGPANLLLVASPLARNLVVGGGIEQRRQVRSFDPATSTATVDRAFAPSARELQEWRIAIGNEILEPIASTPTGSRGMFIWDSREAGLRERVLIKAIPMDTEFGSSAQTSVSRTTENLDVMGIPAGSGFFSVATADLDGDGDLDLACASFGSDSLTLFFQDAPRTFTTVLSLATGSGPRSVVAADLDGDGHLDLVCANGNSDTLTVFFQDAPRVFAPVPAIPTGRFPNSVVAADLDGDGDLDLVCANRDSDTLTVFFQDAPRTFTRGQELATGSVPISVAAADLDNDGQMDLICSNRDSGTLTVFFQGAARVFTAAPPLAAGVYPNSATAADLDGDGDLDIVCANLRSDSLTVFFQGPPRTFTAAPALPARRSPISVAAVDLDGDGDMDIVCANADSNDLTVFIQNGPQIFAAAPPLAAGNLPNSVAAADVDGDGRMDLVCANLFSPTLTVFFQDAQRTFTTALPLATGRSPTALAVADLDGDGDLDLVCANQVSSTLTVFFQDAPRTFTAAQPLATGFSPNSVVASDLDGDGHVDLVCAESSGSLTVFFQDASRRFVTTPPLAAGGVPNSVVAADLDGDGHLDLVCANGNSDSLTVFFQDAPRVFTAAPALATGRFPISVVAADLDGDGDLDIVCANRDSDTLTVFFQAAPRTFTMMLSLPTGSGPRSVVAADLDSDGDLDLVCVNSASNSLNVFFQNAPRLFAAAQTLTVGSDPVSVAAADLDGDGDLDIVCANRGSRTLTVFFQDVSRAFKAAPTAAIGFDPISVVAADVNGDGDVDLACASTSSDTLTVFLGRGR